MADLPTDLVALPTSPWDERPEEIPLVIEECRTALWQTRGNITEAAKTLKVPSGRLRRFVNNSQYLLAEIEEAKEVLVDISESNVYDALTDQQDPGRKDSMTRFVLASQGRKRGWGTGAGPTGLALKGKGRISITWDDGSEIAGEQPGDNAKVVNG